MTAGLYCSIRGTEKRSETLSTAMPMVEACPGLRLSRAGSKRILGPETCGARPTLLVAPPGAALAGTRSGEFAPLTGPAGLGTALCGPVVSGEACGEGFEEGALISSSFRTAGK